MDATKLNLFSIDIGATMTISHAEFLKRYRQPVAGRTFVENERYYEQSSERFWKSFDAIQRLDLPAKSNIIDIGGGIMAVLLSKILEMDACVGDATEGSKNDILSMGLNFQIVDLTSDEKLPNERFDLVVLQEVIEHLPHPPYIVFKRIMKFLKPNGILFLTTPNGSRVRNILYMLAGKPVLDNFRYAGPGETLGHQQEYVLPQLIWQLEKAGMVALSAEQCDDGWRGASFSTMALRTLAKPADLFPHLRNGLMISARPMAVD
jgi:SAM-dependent methyltransferase